MPAMLKEMLLLLVGSVPVFAVINPVGFRLACAAGVLGGLALWWLCVSGFKLWNLAYRPAFTQHLLCAIAAIWTAGCCVGWASAGEVKRDLDRAVASLTSETRAAFTEATDAFVASIGRLERDHPFFGNTALFSPTGSGLKENQRTDHGSTSLGDEAERTVRHALLGHVHEVIFRLQTALLVSCLLLQALAFSLAIYVADRDLRPALPRS